MDRLSCLRTECDTSLSTFRTTFVLASRALGNRIGNLEVLTAGYGREEICQPKKAHTSEEMASVLHRLKQLERLATQQRFSAVADEPP